MQFPEWAELCLHGIYCCEGKWEVTPKRLRRLEREEGGTDSSVGVTRDCLQHMNSIIVYILPAEKVIVPILY